MTPAQPDDIAAARAALLHEWTIERSSIRECARCGAWDLPHRVADAECPVRLRSALSAATSRAEEAERVIAAERGQIEGRLNEDWQPRDHGDLVWVRLGDGSMLTVYGTARVGWFYEGADGREHAESTAREAMRSAEAALAGRAVGEGG